MNDRDLCNTYPTSLFFHSSPTGTNRQPHLMTTLTGSINLWPINRSFFNRPLGMNKESRAIAPPGFPSQSRRKLIHSRSMWNFISITLVLANQCKSSQFAIIGFILQFYVYIFSVPHPRTKAIWCSGTKPWHWAFLFPTPLILSIHQLECCSFRLSTWYCWKFHQASTKSSIKLDICPFAFETRNDYKTTFILTIRSHQYNRLSFWRSHSLSH